MHTHKSAADSRANPPRCPACQRAMLLSGIEWETEARDLHTFACDDCARREVRSVLAA